MASNLQRDANVKEALTSWLQTLDADFYYAGVKSLRAKVGQILKCQW